MVDLRRFLSIVVSIVYKIHPRGMEPFPLGAAEIKRAGRPLHAHPPA